MKCIKLCGKSGLPFGGGEDARRLAVEAGIKRWLGVLRRGAACGAFHKQGCLHLASSVTPKTSLVFLDLIPVSSSHRWESETIHSNSGIHPAKEPMTG